MSQPVFKRKFQNDLMSVMSDIEDYSQESSAEIPVLLPTPPAAVTKSSKEVKELSKVPKKSKIISTPTAAKVKSPNPTKKLEVLQDAPIPASVVTVSVLIRGDISTRILKAWVTNMAKIKSKVKLILSSSFATNSNYIVASGNCTSEVVLGWMKMELFPEGLKVVLPDWIVESLKVGKLLDSQKYLHTLSIAPTTTELSNNLVDDQHHVSNEKDCFVAAGGNNSGNDVKSTQQCQFQNVNNSSSSTLYNHAGEDGHKVEDEVAAVVPKPRLTRHEYMKKTFACATSGTTNTGNANSHITDILDELQSVYELSGDQWRAMGYKKSSAILKQRPKITDIEQVVGLRGVGKSIRDKIKEILDSGKLKKLTHFQDDPRIKAIRELSNIWGVGEKTAETLIKKGFTNIADLRASGQHLLTAQQVIGLRCYEDFLVKIPRAEVEAIHARVSQCMQRIVPGAQCTVCGSYRRGKPQSGDVDVLVTPPPGVERLDNNILAELIYQLEMEGFLTDHLTLPHGYAQHLELRKHTLDTPVLPGEEESTAEHPAITHYVLKETVTGSKSGSSGSSSGGAENKTIGINYSNCHEYTVDETSNGSTAGNFTRQHSGYCEGDELSDSNDSADGDPENQKQSAFKFWNVKSSRGYMGVCNLKFTGSRFRRIDIKAYSRSLAPFALLYFTGSDHFNRSMRLFARKMGYSLNDKGLVVCLRDARQNKIATGQFVPCTTEQEIFAALGLDYKEPWERNCFDIAHLSSAQGEEEKDEEQEGEEKKTRRNDNDSSYFSEDDC